MKLFTNDQLRIIKHNWDGTNAAHVAKLLDMPVTVLQDRLDRLPANFLQIGLDFQERQREEQEEREQQKKEPTPQPRFIRGGASGLQPKPEVKFQRPPAVYSNRSLRNDLLDKYAPLKQ